MLLQSMALLYFYKKDVRMFITEVCVVHIGESSSVLLLCLMHLPMVIIKAMPN